MAKRKRHWGLNLLLILAIIGSILAFAAHAKNWVRVEGDRLRILSGIFYEDIRISEMDSLKWVDKIPQLEREWGFSAWSFEKGTFKDSLLPEQRIRVFVDNLRHRKIKMVYGDSLVVYLNLADSLQSDALYKEFELKKNESPEQFLN